MSIMGNMTGKYWRSRDNWMQFSKVLVGITVYFFQCFFLRVTEENGENLRYLAQQQGLM